MRVRRLVLLLGFIGMPSGDAWAVELAKIDRVISREPIYRSKSPAYGLLVFGPEAKTRVWLVHDGDLLHVDRNGNGDLTEAGEQVLAKKGDSTDAKEGTFLFEIGDIRDGSLTHKNLRVQMSKLDSLADRDEKLKAILAKDPALRGISLAVQVAMPGFQGNGLGARVEQIVSWYDANGYLKFGATPRDAPIIHFRGPWQVTLYGPHQLVVGRQTDLVLGVGTPGLGTGTTAFVAYEGVIPASALPKVEIVYAPKDGRAPVKALYELKERC